MSKHHWNYRVIEFVAPKTLQPWRAIHEVHYEDDRPVTYGDPPAFVMWDTDEPPDTAQKILDMMAEALAKPVLVERDFYAAPR